MQKAAVLRNLANSSILLFSFKTAFGIHVQQPPQIPSALEIFTRPQPTTEIVIEDSRRNTFQPLRSTMQWLAKSPAKIDTNTPDGRKHILKSNGDWNSRLAKMKAKPEDIYYVKFYKNANGRMKAKVTKDIEGEIIVEDLGYVSWAPATVRLARQIKAKYGSTDGARFNIHGLQKWTSKKIKNFMQIHNGFALHAPYAHGHALQANGYIDYKGLGCVRIQHSDRLWRIATRVSQKYSKYGQGLPILVDYSIFLQE